MMISNMTEEKGTWTGFSISDTDRREGAWDAGSAFITWGPEQRALNTSESQASRNPDQRNRPSPTMSGTRKLPWQPGVSEGVWEGDRYFPGEAQRGARCDLTMRFPAQTPAHLHAGQYSAGAWVCQFACLFVLQGALLPSILKAPWHPK